MSHLMIFRVVGGGVGQVISRSIAEYLVQAWDMRNTCKHNGAMLFFLFKLVTTSSFLPLLRGAGVGPMALMLWLVSNDICNVVHCTIAGPPYQC
jgi:hypothetical protein